jgi:hypothetical protein
MTEGEEKTMETHRAYCSACDCQVEVIVRPGAAVNPTTGEREDEVICLAYGESCTGAMCPMSARPVETMRQAFEKHERDDSTAS